MVLQLLLCACAKEVDLNKLPAPLQVDQPTECEKILEPVPVPANGPKDDARLAYLKQKSGLITANGKINTGRECIKDQRMKYGGQPARSEQ